MHIISIVFALNLFQRIINSVISPNVDAKQILLASLAFCFCVSIASYINDGYET